MNEMEKYAEHANTGKLIHAHFIRIGLNAIVRNIEATSLAA